MTGTEEGDEQVEIHVEKEEDDEEIQSRNEVSIAINDYNSERNKNMQITLKSKNQDIPELLPQAIKALQTKFHEESKTESKKAPGTG